MEDDPKFSSIAAWPNDLLVKFAQDAYLRMKEDREIIEQLRLDNKDLSSQLRKYVDDWK